MVNLLCEHSELFSETWPSSGMMRNGQVFALPMQAHLTTDSEFSSSPILGTVTTATSGRSPEFRKGSNPNPVEFVEDLLRTPAASEAERGHQPEDKSKARGGQVTLSGQMMTYFPTPNTMDSLPVREGEPYERALRRGRGEGSERQMTGNLREAVVHNLPTPKARDSQAEGYEAGLRRATPQVGTILKGLVEGDVRVCLPTPTTCDYKDGSEPHQRDGVVQTDTVARAVFNSGEIQLPTPTASDWKGPNHSGSGSASSVGIATAAVSTNWGKFESAIRRWEQTLGRPAPLPTKPDGKEGAHRLSSAFTEWMMGVPEGWITDVGLSRNEELKACGNGVVPQQAALALQVLLEGIELPRGGGQVNLPTPTVSDTFTDNLASSQQKPGSMHSVTLPQAVKWVAGE